MRKFLVVFALACAPSLRAADPQYAVRDLGSFGAPFAKATAVNDSGQIVIAAQPVAGGVFRTFVLDGAKTVELPFGTEGLGINNRGQVVGRYTTGGLTRGFIWENNALTALPTLGGSSSGAAAINERGDVVGFANISIERPRAAVWEKHGGLTELGPFFSVAAKWDPSFALAINARRQVVGYWLNDNSMTVSFLWEDGVYKSISNPLNPQYPMITATGINNRGDITGHTSDWHCGLAEAFVMDKGRTFKLLPIPYAARPRAINNHGEVAGELWMSQYACFGDLRGFVYDGESLVILPPLPGHTESIARAMNERGDVVGQSLGAGTSHAVIWEKK
jgi:probable HAF family extracellular repeat protein